MGRKGAAASTGKFQRFLAAWSWSATIIVCALALASGGAFLLAAPFLPDLNPDNVRADWLGLACLITGLFTANMARMLQIWGQLEVALKIDKSAREKKDHQLIDSGFVELFGYLAANLSALSAFAFFSTSKHIFPWSHFNLTDAHLAQANPLPVLIFLCGLLLAYFPVGLAAYWHSRSEVQNRPAKAGEPHKFLRDDTVSPGTFWTTSIIVCGIVALAVWAADAAGDEAAGLGSWLSFFITFLVISVFIGFIFIPHFLRFLASSKEREEASIRPLGPAPTWKTPVEIISKADSLLVRLLAPLSGATQKRGPHLIVICTLLPLTSMGYVLAPPWGLAPICLAMLIVAGLGRRWAWIEGDRETATRLLSTGHGEIQIGFENDLKDEALLGYAFLFVLVPLSLLQISGWQESAFVRSTGYTGNSFFDWLSFFGAELAKAVPFVDWWEIYNVNISRAYEPSPDNALGKHLTFVARAMVDLVIMAALFQAIGIWQRNRLQRKLYKAGQIDTFDPFLEEQFFKDGVRLAPSGSFEPTPTFEAAAENHSRLRKVLGATKAPYNERRLTELIEHHDDEIKWGANWMVKTHKLLAGPPQNKLKLLADYWDNATHEHLGQEASEQDSHPSVHAEWRREEKARLELVVGELIGKDRETTPKILEDADVENLMRLLMYCETYSEFYYSRMEIVEILAQSQTPAAFWALVAHTCPIGPKFKKWNEEVHNRFGKIVETPDGHLKLPCFGRQEDRVPCYVAISQHALVPHYDESSEDLREICSYLEFMSGCEAKTHARPAAKRALIGLQSFMSDPPRVEEGCKLHDGEIIDIDELEPVI